MTGYRAALFCMLMLVLMPLRAQTGIERIDSFLHEVGSLQAHFEQTLFDEEFTRLDDSSGEMVLQRPGRFRWDYSTPYPQSIISNGSTLWLFDSELRQVTIRNIDAAAANSPSMLLTSDEPLDHHFNIEELPGEADKVWVKLTPKTADASFSVIRIGFTDEQLAAMELIDSFGQTTQIRFSNVTKNAELPDGFFEFIVPDSVDVISDAEQ